MTFYLWEHRRSFSRVGWCVLVALCLTGMIKIYNGGYRFGAQTILSDSMRPAIRAGSLAVTYRYPAIDYRVGDIVTYRSLHSGLVTHRILAISCTENGRWAAITKGDANSSADPNPVQKESIVGKSPFSIPVLGHLNVWINTRPGLWVTNFLIALLGFWVVTGQKKRGSEE